MTRLPEPEADAGATGALLRASAAVIAAAYIVGLAVGEFARPRSAPPSSPVFYLVTAVVLAPFLLPRRWFDRAPAFLRFWMLGAAAVATLRAVFMAGWLQPRLPFADWLTKVVFDVALAAALWLAALSNRQSAIAND